MGDLDELLQSIRDEAKRESALTLYEGTRQDDLVDEEVDERILRLLGLEDTFDIDYATYLSLLKEKMAAARMAKQELPTEEAELLTDEFKRVKRKVGRFTIKKKKIKIDSDNLRAPSKPINSNKLLSPAKQQNILPEGEEEEKRKKKVDTDNKLTTIIGLVTSIRSILEEQLEVNKSIRDAERKNLENQKRKSKEDKSEEKKKATGFMKKLKKSAPKMGLLDSIFNFLKNIILGKAIVGMLEWMSDSENQKKLDTLGKFLGDWWPALTAAFVLFATPLGGFIATVTRMITGLTVQLLKLLPRLMANPFAAAALGLTALGVGAWWLSQDGTAVVKDPDDPDKSAREEASEYGGGAGFTEPFGGIFSQYAGGGLAPLGTDTVPAMLSPGEFVMSKGAVDKFGVDTMAAINAAGGGTNKPKERSGVMFAAGGGPVAKALSELKKDEALSSLTKGVNDYVKPGGRSVVSNTPWSSISNDTMIYPYDDGDGNITIGWGSTYYDDIFSGNKPVGRYDKPITKAEADKIIKSNIKGIHDNYAKRVPHWSKMSDDQKAGMLVVAWNAPYAYGEYPKYTKAINAGDMETAAKELQRGGPSAARIAAERKLFLSGPLDLTQVKEEPKAEKKKKETKPKKPKMSSPDSKLRSGSLFDFIMNPIKFIGDVIHNVKILQKRDKNEGNQSSNLNVSNLTTLIAEAGPGYRPRPGSDAAGNTERLGTNKKWDAHMKMWVPNIPKASIDPPAVAMRGGTITLPAMTQLEGSGNVAQAPPSDPDFPVIAPLSSEVRGRKVATYSGDLT